MRIGLFTDTYFPQINGVATSVFTLSQALEKRGHTVFIFAPSMREKNGDKQANVISMPSMPCFFSKSLKNRRIGLVYPPTTLKKIASLKLDIAHTQTEFSLGSFGRIMAKYFHLPVVHTYHTMYEDYVHYVANGLLISKSMAKEFSKIYCNSADAVIAPTEKVKNALIDYGVTKPISVIPTGVNISRFAKENFEKSDIDELKKSFGFTERDKILVAVGRLAKEKSLDVVIKAMPKLLENMPYAKLLLVGDGPLADELTALADELGVLNKSVIFAGSKPWDEIGKYYLLGDVFVSASVTETQGLTFDEAMAAGLPIVAKEDKCIEGIVKDGVTGRLFKNDDDLPNILLELLSDEKKRLETSKNAENAMKALSAETFALNVEKLYEEILQSKGDAEQKHIPKISVGGKIVVSAKLVPQSIVKRIKKGEKRASALYKISKQKMARIYNHRPFPPKINKKPDSKQ